MKRRVALITAVSAVAAVLGLSACGGGGGGGGDDDTPSSSVKVYDAPALVKTDTTVGTGAVVAAGSTVDATYTLWLYDSTKADFKGTHVQGPASASFSLNGVIAGWSQGIPGMRVGGKRTLIVPSSLGYGAAGQTGIPPNSGLVFDVQVSGTR